MRFPALVAALLGPALMITACSEPGDGGRIPGSGGTNGAFGGSGGFSGASGGQSGSSTGAASGTGGAGAAFGASGGSAGVAASSGGAGGTTAGAGGASAGTAGASGTQGGAGVGGALGGAAGDSGGASGVAGVGGESAGGAGAGGGSSGSAGTGGSSGSGGAAGGATACSGTSSIAKGDSTKTLMVGGASRTYLARVPSSYTGMTPVPLVIDWHPLGGSGMSQKGSSGFQALADQNGFIVVWPNGIDNAWNIGPCCTRSRDVDDLGFAKAIVNELTSTACIDTKRVYSTGFSMGGGMSHFLACNAADIFAAVTPSAFDLLEPDEEPCNPTRPVNVLSFRGTNDSLVPYDGGESNPPNGCCPPITFLGAEGTLERWKTLNGCTGSAMTSGNTRKYDMCMGSVEVGLYTIQGGGHAAGPASAAWDFLKTKSLP